MTDGNRIVLIYTTFPSLEEAKEVGYALVSQRLAACTNIFPGMIAVFEWEGETDESEETAMIIKTRADLTAQVFEEVKRLHSYTLPALLVLEVSDSSPDFVQWVASQTRSPA